jgi:hypothetical protein
MDFHPTHTGTAETAPNLPQIGIDFIYAKIGGFGVWKIENMHDVGGNAAHEPSPKQPRDCRFFLGVEGNSVTPSRSLTASAVPPI